MNTTLIFVSRFSSSTDVRTVSHFSNFFDKFFKNMYVIKKKYQDVRLKPLKAASTWVSQPVFVRHWEGLRDTKESDVELVFFEWSSMETGEGWKIEISRDTLTIASTRSMVRSSVEVVKNRRLNIFQELRLVLRWGLMIVHSNWASFKTNHYNGIILLVEYC